MKKLLTIITLGLMISCGEMGGFSEPTDNDTTVTPMDTINIDTVVTVIDTTIVPMDTPCVNLRVPC